MPPLDEPLGVAASPAARVQQGRARHAGAGQVRMHCVGPGVDRVRDQGVVGVCVPSVEGTLGRNVGRG